MCKSLVFLMICIYTLNLFVFLCIGHTCPPMAKAKPHATAPCQHTYPINDDEQSEAKAELNSSDAKTNPHGEVRIFAKVVSSNKTIQSQQRGEPDLREDQKLNILASLMRDKPGSFLMRFGSLLDKTDLDYIESVVKLDYEVNYRLKELKKYLGLSTKSHRKRIQNRRFQCLNQLMENSNYFSEEEMRHRNPLLFEHYVGQYLTQEEKDSMDMGDRADMTLSGLILNKMKIDSRRALLRRQQDLESGQIEETDSDTEEVDDAESMEISSDAQVDDHKKRTCHQEFLRVMQLSFLNGEDSEFDYSKVDDSEEYDSLNMIGRDAEDTYFDEELPTVDLNKDSEFDGDYNNGISPVESS